MNPSDLDRKRMSPQLDQMSGGPPKQKIAKTCNGRTVSSACPIPKYCNLEDMTDYCSEYNKSVLLRKLSSAQSHQEVASLISTFPETRNTEKDNETLITKLISERREILALADKNLQGYLHSLGASPEQPQSSISVTTPTRSISSCSTQTDSNQDLYKHSSNLNGLGCFTQRNYDAGHFIGLYSGPMVYSYPDKNNNGKFFIFKVDDSKEPIQIIPLDSHKYVAWTSGYLDKSRQIGIGIDGSNTLRYLNHSDNPNTKSDITPNNQLFNWKSKNNIKIKITTLKPINEMEELTMDYGFKNDQDKKFDNMASDISDDNKEELTKIISEIIKNENAPKTTPKQIKPIREFMNFPNALENIIQVIESITEIMRTNTEINDVNNFTIHLLKHNQAEVYLNLLQTLIRNDNKDLDTINELLKDLPQNSETDNEKIDLDTMKKFHNYIEKELLNEKSAPVSYGEFRRAFVTEPETSKSKRLRRGARIKP